ncbi:ras-related protein Rab7-like [Hibiscus syriacus]|uniref:ras-related protein Rab7-like n=1 Tax=Hibiscus syriacus TaxID=106335 RepID=UPI0019231464|nr:ras-related protein Rab7-like [Hibiscus syriacus]
MEIPPPTNVVPVTPNVSTMDHDRQSNGSALNKADSSKNDPYGPWMVVEKRRCRPQAASMKKSDNSKYVHKKFSQHYKATIGADFVTKELQIDDRLVTLQGELLWIDIGYCRTGDFCVLVYDVNVMKSFDTLDNWHEEFLEQPLQGTFPIDTFSSQTVRNEDNSCKIVSEKKANPTDPRMFPFTLLGNKIDIDDGNSRVVSKKKAKDRCASKGNMPYFETSAKEDINVDAAFLCVAKNALTNEREQDIYFQGIPEAVTETEQRGGCAC